MPVYAPTTASPRFYSRHQRYRKFGHLRYSEQEIAWLEIQAARLGVTVAQVFAKLDTYTSGQIKNAVSFAALP